MNIQDIESILKEAKVRVLKHLKYISFVVATIVLFISWVIYRILP